MAYKLKNLSESERQHFESLAQICRTKKVVKVFLHEGVFLHESDITQKRISALLSKKLGVLMPLVDIPEMYKKGDYRIVRHDTYEFSFFLA